MGCDPGVALGSDKAKGARDIAAESLSPEQIAEAKQMATQCQARDYQGC